MWNTREKLVKVDKFFFFFKMGMFIILRMETKKKDKKHDHITKKRNLIITLPLKKLFTRKQTKPRERHFN